MRPPIDMRYRLYCSSGNSVGVVEYLCYSEIGPDSHVVRYIEVRADGAALRYSEAHPADSHGELPVGVWEEAEAIKPEYGTVAAISAQLFEAIWSTTRCLNDQQPR